MRPPPSFAPGSVDSDGGGEEEGCRALVLCQDEDKTQADSRVAVAPPMLHPAMLILAHGIDGTGLVFVKGCKGQVAAQEEAGAF